MVISHLYLALLTMAPSARSQVIAILDTRADYVGYKEGDVDQLNFATLIADEKADLPDKFTLCSSIFQDSLSLHTAWLEILKEDFTHWFYIYPLLENAKQDTESIFHSLWMNVNGASYYFSDFGPVRYNRWIQACVSLDLETGLISLVVDDYIIQSKVVEGLAVDRPFTLAGRVVLGKVFYFGAWHQANTLVGNLQVFGRLLSEKEMISLTVGDGCGSEGDYMAWTQVELEHDIILLYLHHPLHPDEVGRGRPSSCLGQYKSGGDM